MTHDQKASNKMEQTSDLEPYAYAATLRHIPMPARIARLPISSANRMPIPWFVATLDDGTRDFRIADHRKMVRAINGKLCWVCGERLGRHMAFLIGPMCAVNRVTAEPPCHLDCAEFSALACPFLSRPKMRRNDNDLPDGHQQPPGEFITRNPGVSCLWVTQSYKLFKAGDRANDALINIGVPTDVRWYAERKPATRQQVMESIDSGYPLLLSMAHEQGPEAVAALAKQLDATKSLVYATTSE